jgi:hypothetical protein
VVLRRADAHGSRWPRGPARFVRRSNRSGAGPCIATAALRPALRSQFFSAGSAGGSSGVPRTLHTAVVPSDSNAPQGWSLHLVRAPRPDPVRGPCDYAVRGEGADCVASLVRDSIVLLLAQHTVRLTFEDGTRESLAGPFFEEWFASAGALCCWNDGDRKTTNYLWHPLLGSTTSFVFANNHPASQETPIGSNRRYWKAKGAQGRLLVHLRDQLRAWAAVGSLDRQRWSAVGADDVLRLRRHARDRTVDLHR